MSEPSPIDSSLVVVGGSPAVPMQADSKAPVWRDWLLRKLTVLHRWLSQPKILALLVAGSVLGLAYLPNFRDLYSIWIDDPNYSHGRLVIPIALVILWQRLSAQPAKSAPSAAKSSSKVSEQPVASLRLSPELVPPSRLRLSSPHTGGAGWVY